jgi:hypothetical protein
MFHFWGGRRNKKYCITKFTAVAYIVKGQFLCDRENMVKFVVLQDGTLRLVVPIREGQTFVPRHQS